MQFIISQPEFLLSAAFFYSVLSSLQGCQILYPDSLVEWKKGEDKYAKLLLEVKEKHSNA